MKNKYYLMLFFLFILFFLSCSSSILKVQLEKVEDTIKLFNKYLNNVDNLIEFKKIESLLIKDAKNDFDYIYKKIKETDKEDENNSEIEFLKDIYRNLYIYIIDKEPMSSERCNVLTYYFNKKYKYHKKVIIFLQNIDNMWFIYNFKIVNDD